jgi:hypothetical protein
MARKTRDHVRPLPGDADVLVRLVTDRGELVEYSVVLRVHAHGTAYPVRLWDFVERHREHHMHRYNSRGEKETPEVLTHATVQAGMNAAIAHIRDSGGAIIEAWRRR